MVELHLFSSIFVLAVNIVNNIFIFILFLFQFWFQNLCYGSPLLQWV